MKKNQIKPYLHAGVTAFAVIVVSILFFFVMFHIRSVWNVVLKISYILRPIFMGLVIAFLLLPVHKWFFRTISGLFNNQKWFGKKASSVVNGVSIMLSLCFAFAVLYILLAMVIPQVYLSIVGLVDSIPDYILTAQQWLAGFLEDNPEIQSAFLSYYNAAALTVEEWLNNKIIPNLQSVSTTFNWFKETILPNVTGVISNVSSLLITVIFWLKDVFIAIIVSVYLLARKDIFAAQSKKIVYSIFKPKYGDLIVGETRSAYRVMSGFINGKLLDSLIIGIITLFCCNIFHFPYAALIATIIGVTNIIPFFGPFIGAIPSALLILLVDPLKCLYFVIFVFVLQQFDGNILGPRILGESTGLASFWVLFSILLFGGLFGFAGMVLGVPCFAIIYSILRRMVHRGLRRNHLPIETDEYIGITKNMASSDDSAETEKEI